MLDSIQSKANVSYLLHEDSIVHVCKSSFANKLLTLGNRGLLIIVVQVVLGELRVGLADSLNLHAVGTIDVK